jgi:hypothetical protein
VINIDKQRVAAVRKLEQLGYKYDGREWVPPASATTAVTQHSILTEADALLSALVLRADPSRAVSKDLRRRPRSPSSPTRSRPTKRYAGPRARCREGKDRPAARWRLLWFVPPVFEASADKGESEPDTDTILDILQEQFPGITMKHLSEAGAIYGAKPHQ